MALFMRLASRPIFSKSTTTASAINNAALRSFTSNTSYQAQGKAPALADVKPDQGHIFDAKQKDFRENYSKKKREREQRERQYSESKSTHSSLSGSQNSPAADVTPLGDLSTHSSSETGEAAKQQTNDDGSKKQPGRLSSFIYGTEEGREMDREIERSFSQVLARGKYVHSIVFHEVKPDKVDEYTELVGSWYPKVAGMPENKVNLVGSWRTEVGDCDTFVHIWEYQRYSGYHESLNNIQHHPEFPDFDRKLKSLINSKRTSLMQEFSFWPTSAPRKLGGVFELRSYTLNPGSLLEWESHWRTGLDARKKVMEGVGAWFCQIGDLNTVHHLWQFADLEERRARREQSWVQPGWGETVHRTVPLIQTMKSKILVPCPWSPIS